MSYFDAGINNQLILENEARRNAYLARLGGGRTNSGGTTTGTSNLAFSGGAEDALNALITQLTGAGTPEQQQSRAQRQEEITTVRGQRADYSKAAAFADAQSAVSAQQRQALEKLLPAINNASRGAGTSQSSMRALLLQDAAQKAADSAALLGLDTATKYGGISANLSAILENLTRQDNPQTKALLDALQIAKGSNANTSSNMFGGDIGTGGGGGVQRTLNNNAGWENFYAGRQQKEFADLQLKLLEQKVNPVDFESVGPVTPRMGDNQLALAQDQYNQKNTPVTSNSGAWDFFKF